LDPVSDRYGYDRGSSADRALVDAFIATHAADIRGDVLEVRDPLYTGRYDSGITSRHVLDIDNTNRAATMIADLGQAESLPRGRFDCFVMTQTLYLIRNPVTALRNAYDCLRPGGVLLLTTPVVARIDPTAGPAGDYWRLEPAGLETLLRASLPADADVEVGSAGNVLVCVSTLMGIAAEELSADELHHNDPRYPVIAVARVVRSE
jgi:SAM-dependent methyltransferase